MKPTYQEEVKKMSRKRVVLLTFTTGMVFLVTTIAVWIHNAEAHASLVETVNVTEYCVDTTTTHPQNDICSTDEYTLIKMTYPSQDHPKKKSDPDHTSHGTHYDDVDDTIFVNVTSCSQCP